VAALFVDQVFQRRFDDRPLIGNEPRDRPPRRRRDRAAKPVLERGDAFILVHPLRGAVADRYEAYNEFFGFSHGLEYSDRKEERREVKGETAFSLLSPISYLLSHFFARR
jgi:hypothetical protein